MEGESRNDNAQIPDEFVHSNRSISQVNLPAQLHQLPHESNQLSTASANKNSFHQYFGTSRCAIPLSGSENYPTSSTPLGSMYRYPLENIPYALSDEVRRIKLENQNLECVPSHSTDSVPSHSTDSVPSHSTDSVYDNAVTAPNFNDNFINQYRMNQAFNRQFNFYRNTVFPEYLAPKYPDADYTYRDQVQKAFIPSRSERFYPASSRHSVESASAFYDKYGGSHRTYIPSHFSQYDMPKFSNEKDFSKMHLDSNDALYPTPIKLYVDSSDKTVPDNNTLRSQFSPQSSRCEVNDDRFWNKGDAKLSFPSTSMKTENSCFVSSESSNKISNNLPVKEINFDSSVFRSVSSGLAHSMDYALKQEPFSNSFSETSCIDPGIQNNANQMPFNKSDRKNADDSIIGSYSNVSRNNLVQEFLNYSNTSSSVKSSFKQEIECEETKSYDEKYPINVPIVHSSQQDVPSPHQHLPTSSNIPSSTKERKQKPPKVARTPIVHKCEECERIFKNSTQLKNHKWHHTGEKPFSCTECGSKFTQQGNLRAHKRIHTGERPYECDECKTCFTQLSTLKTHQKIHSNERPYHCSECDASFRQVANLKTHFVVHTGEKPHKCDLCEKAFTQKSNLKAHKNRVHENNGRSVSKRGRRRGSLVGVRPYYCPECGAKFTMISNLNTHMKLHSDKSESKCSNMSKKHKTSKRVLSVPASKSLKLQCIECQASFSRRKCLENHLKNKHTSTKIKEESHVHSTADGIYENYNADDIETDSCSGDEHDCEMSESMLCSTNHFIAIKKDVETNDNLEIAEIKKEDSPSSMIANNQEISNKSELRLTFDHVSSTSQDDQDHSNQSE